MIDDFEQRFAEESDKAIASENIDAINTAIDKLNALKSDLDEGLILSQVLYCLSNLHNTKSQIEKERIDEWRKSRFPQNLVQSLNYIRQAYSMAVKYNSLQSLDIQTNLANNIRSFNRFVEAIYYYTFDYNYNLQIDSQYVAPYNKAETLMQLKELINERTTNIHYSFQAFNLINELSKNKDKITHAGIKDCIEKEAWVKNILRWGDSVKLEYEKLNEHLK